MHAISQLTTWKWVTLNNAPDYRTNGLYRTPDPNPSLLKVKGKGTYSC